MRRVIYFPFHFMLCCRKGNAICGKSSRFFFCRTRSKAKNNPTQFEMESLSRVCFPEIYLSDSRNRIPTGNWHDWEVISVDFSSREGRALRRLSMEECGLVAKELNEERSQKVFSPNFRTLDPNTTPIARQAREASLCTRR